MRPVSRWADTLSSQSLRKLYIRAVGLLCPSEEGVWCGHGNSGREHAGLSGDQVIGRSQVGHHCDAVPAGILSGCCVRNIRNHEARRTGAADGGSGICIRSGLCRRIFWGSQGTRPGVLQVCLR